MVQHARHGEVSLNKIIKIISRFSKLICCISIPFYPLLCTFAFSFAMFYSNEDTVIFYIIESQVVINVLFTVYALAHVHSFPKSVGG